MKFRASKVEVSPPFFGDMQEDVIVASVDLEDVGKKKLINL